ncbi:MAG TPA: amino acid ABC transporter permease [Mycobacteriales bacterium]|nr:amino acid ABC transporter permease [Mycobacteriales bacterium]
MTGAAPAEAPLALSDKEQWRREYRRQRARRSTLVATVSTILFAVVVWLGVTHTPGWDDARATFFSWDSIRHDTPDIARGMLLNLKILVIGEACILVLGMIVAILRTSTGAVFAPLRIFGGLYVDFFRGCPLIILLYLFGVGIPSLQLSWLPNSATVWGTVAIVLCYSSYVAEVFRAGLQSVHPSQRAAARSLGLTHQQTLRLVVVPQAVRAVLPPLLNDFVALQKDVGLISIVGGATDAIQQATIDNSLTFNFTPYVIAALLFIALAVPSGRIADMVAARANSRQRAGAVV